ncbi:pyridine nucleotide-disulfide oxidoreductase [Salipaludibacillus neizhouensis]|uniref:Pyridine nucleotide-disulfide oxidoreductase n=1 Tax=Salipaludibacillus neizhouensis TaxID=885475 RepID=A0A3A9KF92_9BACI|nr:FAD-dependent oxidoreductase [Salipaludibacillus neizhouensis]RKL69251.1 pyridine nucleotide-disulfide oxidoreductase [Salipaludibacillus neizhouensis]
MEKYDLIVLGGGAAGLTVASGASSLGAKVALVEKNEQPGGDCLHVGCIPSKALIEIANTIYSSKNTEQYGMTSSGEVNMKQINSRVHESIAHIQKHDDADRFRDLGIDVYIGSGAFLSKNEIIIDGKERIFGKRIVIATGTRPLIPPIEGLKESGFLTNEMVFDLEELPNRIVFIGGGPTGVELAQAFSRLGSKVTIIERSSSIFKQEDKEIRENVQIELEKEVSFVFNASVTNVHSSHGEKIVTIQKKDKSTEELTTDEIFLATGRTPNSDKLDLDNAGVKQTDSGHISVNNKLQTNIPSIYAIGDVNGTLPFTHIAGMEGKLIVQNAVLGLRRKVDYTNAPWVIYTNPEVFHLGNTEEELQEKKLKYDVFKVSLANVDRFVADHKTEGLVKILTNKRGYILGAHATGKGAGDFMQEVIFAKQYKKKIGDLSQVIHPYPNHAAAVQSTADLYWRKKLFEGSLPKVIKKYIKWFR